MQNHGIIEDSQNNGVIEDSQNNGVIEGSQNHGVIEGSPWIKVVRITVLLKVVIEGSQNHGVIEGIVMQNHDVIECSHTESRCHWR